MKQQMFEFIQLLEQDMVDDVVIVQYIPGRGYVASKKYATNFNKRLAMANYYENPEKAIKSAKNKKTPTGESVSVYKVGIEILDLEESETGADDIGYTVIIEEDIRNVTINGSQYNLQITIPEGYFAEAPGSKKWAKVEGAIKLGSMNLVPHFHEAVVTLRPDLSSEYFKRLADGILLTRGIGPSGFKQTFLDLFPEEQAEVREQIISKVSKKKLAFHLAKKLR